MIGQWFLALLLAAVSCAAVLQPTCDSQVYCYGRILHTVQLLKPRLEGFEDSKTFVDMKLKNSQAETIQKFNVFMEETGHNPTREQVRDFLSENFEREGGLEKINSTDWVESPEVLNKISDPSFKQWARDLNFRWNQLTRKVSLGVKTDSDKYSIIYVPHPFVVPGGRFREYYYWDTYWIIRGLLLSNMTNTVKGILQNFMYLIENYGIVPNGGRIYYLRRSQPPLLTPMVLTYFDHTHDLDFVRDNIQHLETEFHFWMRNRTIQVTKDGKTYTLARYNAVTSGPRPESYREDYNHAQNFNNNERRESFYADLKSGAESGWDFSSRWFIKNGTNAGNLSDIHTRSIIPVDLNAFLYWNADILSHFFTRLGNNEKSQYYKNLASQWKEAVTAVMWDEEEGVWFDYDISNNIPRKYFYSSNLVPLWTKCYDERNVESITQKVVRYIREKDFLDTWGIPTSLDATFEQWDYPNAWPPLQAIIIQGLEYTRQPKATDLAFALAKRWIRSNYQGYSSSQSNMYEKYNVEGLGNGGNGGEYVVQRGFGWTNGVVMELLAAYGANLTRIDN